MTKKIRKNFTLNIETAELLEKVAKKHPKLNQSKAIEYAIQQTFKDPLEHARQKMKHHQKELMKWKEEKERLEQIKNKIEVDS